MSAARNLRAWDALWEALQGCGAWGHVVTERPTYEAVKRAVDELDAASPGGLTSRQLEAVADLVEAAVAAATSPSRTGRA